MKKHRWLDVTEYALLLGAGAGTVASVATQQMIFASAPLSLLVAIGLVNRQQLEHQLARERASMRTLDHKLSNDLDELRDQVAELPTPDILTGFQRSMVAQTEQSVARFSRALEHTRQQLEKQIDEIETPDLSLVYQDVMQLQDQYTYLCTALNNTQTQLQQIANTSRLEATETEMAQLKTTMMQLRVNLESFSTETKSSYSALRDRIQHVERQLRQLPLQSDPHFLKQEVHELVKVVSDLVPRPEFLDLTLSFQELRDQHRQLRQLVSGLRHLPTLDLEPEPIDLTETATSVDQTLRQLTHGLSGLEQALIQATEPSNNGANGSSAGSDPTLSKAINQAVANYLQQFRLPLERLRQLTDALESQQQSLTQQLTDIPQALDVAAVTNQLELLQNRVDQSDEQLGVVKQSVDDWLAQAPHTTPMGGDAQWIFDFPATSPETQVLKSSSRKALEQALMQAQSRLLIVWPWNEETYLDEEMLERFRLLLERQCQLEIGWCHIEESHEGRLLRKISKRWGDYSCQRQKLKTALNKLLPLKQAYPNLFKFKVLGTRENFLVCDRNFAILGVQALETQSSVLPHMQLKLRTTNTQVIQKLIQRFDNPTLDAKDAAAYFNRATTRYDLRDQPGAIADYTQVIELNPAHVIAYNNRGLAWAELGETEKALQDFSRAINLDTHLFAAHCNRGILRLEQRDYHGAIADCSEAIRLQPGSAISYFYRGQAHQASGHFAQAIADFTAAIERHPDLALPYCYRSAAYQKQGDTRRAIADLEIAARQLSAVGDINNLNQVVKTLEKLKQTAPVRATATVGR